MKTNLRYVRLLKVSLEFWNCKSPTMLGSYSSYVYLNLFSSFKYNLTMVDDLSEIRRYNFPKDRANGH